MAVRLMERWLNHRLPRHQIKFYMKLMQRGWLASWQTRTWTQRLTLEWPSKKQSRLLTRLLEMLFLVLTRPSQTFRTMEHVTVSRVALWMTNDSRAYDLWQCLIMRHLHEVNWSCLTKQGFVLVLRENGSSPQTIRYDCFAATWPICFKRRTENSP
ncbi:hypothetical protein JG687_00015899 [Phytophthora cactorum]|uniref:Uncharacterized protein n=1 Tax=Phytophthora cactorum TaxID=29920 RepID=A0A8T1TV29_9STRA|nr:hypothetical protein JG687_00015899 [Phytophthora cactorum]